ncbi:hypothetical protein BHE74_00032447 [Ensete ventricosum]|nr:hypothetical protein GW17_00025713 [Ensete ventricosum]RWW60546.1 hypothetical protein BHE74_00032447 [Ensete ventricosum]RZS04530.1 hypothetical protein BHM03_00034874 [Ensete ventricosum]
MLNIPFQHTAGQLRSRKTSSPGSAKAPEHADVVTFADVAGVDEAKEELEEIVVCQKFLTDSVSDIVVGLPGTGKTLLAKAVAGEAEVPFISCSASEFVELYVGMGASRVRDLFARAKKEAPSIIFIDEVINNQLMHLCLFLLMQIDAVAKSRDGRYRIVSNDEREQTLNQLLTEMDGFDSNSAVIVLGATNRADVLDPALRRPGRFDRVVMVYEISANAILECLNIPQADLANLVNEAALLAGRANKVVVEKIDFILAVERSIAVCGALGFTYTPPTTEDRYLLFIDELRGRLVTLLGGRAAEEVVYSGRVSTGALDDIKRATDMAYKAVAEYGLNQNIGPVSLATLSSGGLDDSGGAEKEKVEGEELQEWLKLVVAPVELTMFIQGKHEDLLQLKAGS